LIQATQNFGPGGSASSSPTPAEVTGAVDSICTGSVSTACSDSLIRGKLGDFYSACSAELTSNPNEQLRNIYDVLYALTPLQQAICSKDDSGNYCVIAGNNASSTGTQSAPSAGDLNEIQKTLYYTPTSGSLSTRDEDAILANLTTFHVNNLAFLLLQPNMDSDALCTTCTRNILTSYFNYESDALYGPGLSSSVLLAGQTDLVGAIQQKCGANFLNGAVEAAGGIKQDAMNAAVKGVSDRFAALTAIVAGVLTVALSLL
jgi:hypothetical protein